MPMMGGFLGGVTSAIPAGYGQVILTWITTDGENRTCTFQIRGSTNIDGPSDANGRYSLELPVGTYAVTPVHEGNYVGDGVKVIEVQSRQSYSLSWIASRNAQKEILFYSPSTSSSATYKISSSDGTIQYAGVGWNAEMAFSLYVDEYVLDLVDLGIERQLLFKVGSTTTSIDCSSMFCKFTLSGLKGLNRILINGVSVGDEISSSYERFVLKTTSAEVSVACTSAYSGLSTASLGAYTSPTITADFSEDEQAISLNFVGAIVMVTDDGDLGIPCQGVYDMLVIGGGGYGYNSGGGSGRIKSGEVTLNAQAYSVTIGAGGTSDDHSGGATSFGTIMSASGGSSGEQNGLYGGVGGAGGGAYSFYAKGGAGEYGGGGGGAGWGVNSGSDTGSIGGAGGTYGGAGGTGGFRNRLSDAYIPATAGADGSTPAVGSIYYGSTSSGGTGGSGRDTGNNYGIGGGGGGGGGGRGASGGDGAAGVANSSYTYGGGGGGGGGVAGGTGGNGGPTGGKSQYGYAGRGYGAGGGGLAGGGGGGGLSSTKIATDGGSYGPVHDSSHGKGAKGAVRLQYIR